MEFRILGPLEVVEHEEPVALGTLKERLVLGVLLLHANEFVSRERLIDDLWGEAPPPTARQAVNVYLSQLRKALGRTGGAPITTASGSYSLRIEPDRLDADRAQLLIASARECVSQGELDTAAERFREALSFWRGPTLAGLQFEALGRDEAARLDELRLAALMDRIDCDLALGRHEQVLGELNLLVREHPLRERLRAQQMLALYRADRQTDALDSYAEARHALVDDLGIEPSAALQRLQQAILRHDASLETPTGTAAANGAAPVPVGAAASASPPGPRPRRRPLRPRYLVAAGLVVVAAIAVPVAVLSTRGGGVRPPSSPVSSVGPNEVAALDPATGALVSVFGGGLEPGPMALVGERLWTGGRGSGSIERYDVRARHGMPPLQPGPALDDIAVDADGHVWVSDRKPDVTWIGHVADGTGPYERPVVSTERIGVPLPGAGAEAVGGGYLWVISDLPRRIGESVSLIDVRSRRVSSTTQLGRQTTAIAYGYRAAWIGAYDPETSTAWLLKVRPGSSVESLELENGDGAGPLAVAVGEGAVWVVTSRGSLMRIDPGEPQIVRRISMSAEQPTLLAVGAGSVWTANHSGYSVSQIDPSTNRIVRTTPPLGRYDAIPCGIEATRGAVFVAFGETSCGGEDDA
jgi:DNA-binding SARP family transcriptional activator/streptogramin lyase